MYQALVIEDLKPAMVRSIINLELRSPDLGFLSCLRNSDQGAAVNCQVHQMQNVIERGIDYEISNSSKYQKFMTRKQKSSLSVTPPNRSKRTHTLAQSQLA